MLEKMLSSVHEKFKIENKKLKIILSAFFAGGNILFTDDPGTGKTTLSKLIADVLDLNYKRVQFTPDISPSDVLGVNVFNLQKQQWELHEGPVFTDILLVDEINRAAPRTQSALLEAMAEKQITIDKIEYSLGRDFFVMATQNPLEEMGVFDLPSAQKDRFMINVGLNHLSEDDEMQIMLGKFNYSKTEAVLSRDEITDIRKQIESMIVPETVLKYALKIVKKTREHTTIQKGVSTRAAQDLIKLSKAYAYMDGKKAVEHDHIFELAPFVFPHRLVLKDEYFTSNPEEIIISLLKEEHINYEK